MADQDKQDKQDGGEGIDYTKSSADVAKAKAKAHDADTERLAKEHESTS